MLGMGGRWVGRWWYLVLGRYCVLDMGSWYTWGLGGTMCAVWAMAIGRYCMEC